jgi:hypothetical protein
MWHAREGEGRNFVDLNAAAIIAAAKAQVLNQGY